MEIKNLRIVQTSEEFDEIQKKQFEVIKTTAFIEEPFEFMELWDIEIDGEIEFVIFCTDPDSASIFIAGTTVRVAMFLQSTLSFYSFTADDSLKNLLTNIYKSNREKLPDNCILKHFWPRK